MSYCRKVLLSYFKAVYYPRRSRYNYVSIAMSQVAHILGLGESPATLGTWRMSVIVLGRLGEGTWFEYQHYRKQKRISASP